MIHQCTFWVHRGSELCLGGGEGQELPTDINAASSISQKRLYGATRTD